MAGVYISYPFCAQKCTYCNFASGVSPQIEQRHYEHALLHEIERHSWRWTPETVYLGGGTPSQMPLPVLEALLAAIPGRHWAETTLECAPGTVTREKAEAWARLGINRVSLGVQSFVEKELRQTGRRHTAQTVVEELELLTNAGIVNVNIDLIAGLPGQTRESWHESLHWIEQLNPPHVSVYIFEVDEDSRLGKEALLGGTRYGAELLPTDDLTAELYETAVRRLHSLGILRYEISNFARPGFESKHNLKYWTLAQYAGFGLDAHSFDGEHRTSNTDDLSQYMALVEQGESPAADSSTSDLEEEHFFVGLRLQSGIVPSPQEWHRFSAPIQRGLASGLLLREADRLRLSDRGVLLSNELFQEFIGQTVL